MIDKRHRQELVAQGRRLCTHDLRARLADDELARAHQLRYLGRLTRMQWHTWFKTQAFRAQDGLDPTGKKKISSAERAHRLKVAAGALLPPYVTGTGEAGRTLGVGGGPGLRKRGETDRREFE
jgi:hypothetical protein